MENVCFYYLNNCENNAGANKNIVQQEHNTMTTELILVKTQTHTCSSKTQHYHISNFHGDFDFNYNLQRKIISKSKIAYIFKKSASSMRASKFPSTPSSVAKLFRLSICRVDFLSSKFKMRLSAWSMSELSSIKATAACSWLIQPSLSVAERARHTKIRCCVTSRFWIGSTFKILWFKLNENLNHNVENIEILVGFWVEKNIIWPWRRQSEKHNFGRFLQMTFFFRSNTNLKFVDDNYEIKIISKRNKYKRTCCWMAVRSI